MDKFSELWCLYFAASYMEGMAAKTHGIVHKSDLKRIAGIVRHHADVHRTARNDYAKRRRVEEKRVREIKKGC